MKLKIDEVVLNEQLNADELKKLKGGFVSASETEASRVLYGRTNCCNGQDLPT